MKKYVLLVISVFLSTYFAIGQTFTANDYKKASWMTLRFYGGQRSSMKDTKPMNWLVMDHLDGLDFTKDADGGNDLSGGWFDCGDHVKFGQTEFYAAYVVLKGYSEWPSKMARLSMQLRDVRPSRLLLWRMGRLFYQRL